MEIGLTLSGGGARGIAHVAVLQALEQLDLKPKRILGTSAGALAGVLYAAGHSPDEILKLALNGSVWKMINPMLSFKALSSHNYFDSILKKYVKESSFESLAIPVHIGVTNLTDGAHEIWSSGPLFDLVKASCSIPGIFAPIEIQGKQYLDGGTTNNMPVKYLRDQCDYVIGSNVVTADHVPTKRLGGIHQIIARVFEVSLTYRSQFESQFCDVLIEPPGINQYGMFEFGKGQEIFEKTYELAIGQLSQWKKEQITTESNTLP